MQEGTYRRGTHGRNTEGTQKDAEETKKEHRRNTEGTHLVLLGEAMGDAKDLTHVHRTCAEHSTAIQLVQFRV